MSKNNIIIGLLILLVLFLSYKVYVNPSDPNRPTPGDILSDKLIPAFVDNKIALGVGISFDDKIPVILDTLTGKNIKPCKMSSNIKSENYTNFQKTVSSKTKNNGCMSQIAMNSSSPMSIAIESTKSPITGTILVNGKEQKVTMTLVGFLDFKGSYCNSIYVQGDQYEECITEEQACENRLALFERYYPTPIPEPFCKSLPNCTKFYPDCPSS